MPETKSHVRNSENLTISIVSHGHGAMVTSLLSDLAMHRGSATTVIVTLNIPETLAIDASGFPFQVQIIRNSAPKGFGANHNAAFTQCKGGYFCILNPDIRIREDPFPALIEELARARVGLVAPKILNPSGDIEDSARHFPTAGSLTRKLLGVGPGLDHNIGQKAISPDWVAGMFMLFRSSVFQELLGFDERYFLYYEDVDLCRRLRKRGYEVLLVPTVSAVHDARRESHRNLRHLSWHLVSIARFLLSG
jgi:N-acetylglucosaminyl-diphospho-decaprenol L-rhamnosyltransferase